VKTDKLPLNKMYQFKLSSTLANETIALFRANKKYYRRDEIPYYSFYTNNIQVSKIPHEAIYPISMLSIQYY
jgi:hypothetical protein